MKKQLINLSLLLLLLIRFPSESAGQSLAQDVIGNIGGVTNNEDFGSLHWTLGEMMTKTMVADNTSKLTQGFHQSYYDFITTATDVFWESDYEVKLYPNPTSGNIFLSWQGIIPDQIVIANQLGQIIKKIDNPGKNTAVDLQGFPEGIYFLSLIQERTLIKTFKIIKY